MWKRMCIDWNRIRTSYVCKTTQWGKKWGDYENRGEREKVRRRVRKRQRG